MRKIVRVIRLFNLYGHTGGSFAGNVYDPRGCAPSVSTCEGGNREPLVIVKNE